MNLRDVFSSSSNRNERWRQHSYEMKSYNEDEGKEENHCLWMFTLILGIIGFCNLLLSTTIIFVLRVSQGMEALEVIPDENIVKFYGNTDLDRVSISTNHLLMILLCDYYFLNKRLYITLYFVLHFFVSLILLYDHY